MSKKNFFERKSFIVALLLFFLLTQELAANVFSKPRKLFSFKTEHFELIYSEQSKETATYVSQKIEELYSRAVNQLNYDAELKMPVVISSDSDVLSVTYTSSPYNRIVIFDSIKNDKTQNFEDALISLLYREIYRALAQSIRSPFNQFVSKWLAGDSYQPVALFNLPYSFVQGIAYLAESEKGEGRLNDGYFLQLLSQAKLEHKFPKWITVSSVIDVYPGEELALAAGSGFAAFLISTYGAEKYAALWQECGKINPLLTHGVFKNVYGIPLNELWAAFEEAVPLPQKLAELQNLESQSALVFPKDKEANYEHILLSDYGFVWYDRLRHEVDMFDENNLRKIRQLLFLADNIERMTLSCDSRFISVSHTQPRTMQSLYSDYTNVYDLIERRFLEPKYSLRDAAIVQTSDGKNVLAGVTHKKSTPVLQIYSIPQKDKKAKLLYEKAFEQNQIPFSPVFSGKGAVCYILDEGSSQTLCRLVFDGEKKDFEQKWLLKTADSLAAENSVKIRKLNFQRANAPAYTFEFAKSNEPGFTRLGMISLNQEWEPAALMFFGDDVSGGIHESVINGDSLFYTSKKFQINELRQISLSALSGEPGELVKIDENDNREKSFYEPATLAESDLTDSDLAQADFAEAESQEQLFSETSLPKKLYNPFKYLLDVSFSPFLPIKTIDLDTGIIYWPGLGVSVKTQTDPCMNTSAVLSAGWNYVPLDFSWSKNLPSAYLRRLRLASEDLKKDKSAAFFIENSSTPVNLKGGVLFNYTLDGEYDFSVLAGGQWKMPIGFALRKLIFNVQFSYKVSTDYYDQTLIDSHPSLSNWPNFNNAYELVQASVSVEYNNIHQYGFSPFEKRGLSIGAKLFALWDIYEINLLRQAREEEKRAKQENISEEERNGNLSNAQLKNLFQDSLMDITQLNVALFATVAIPRLNPLNSVNGWILSLPATVSVEFMNKAGTALESRTQILLIGKEIHKGISPIFLYFRRVGFSIGYDMSLIYDTAEVRLPDIRNDNYLAEVFNGVKYTHYFFFVLNFDLNYTAGALSSIPINAGIRGSYFPDTNGYVLNLDLRFHL